MTTMALLLLLTQPVNHTPSNITPSDGSIVVTNGARIDFGTGASDYVYSNGDFNKDDCEFVLVLRDGTLHCLHTQDLQVRDLRFELRELRKAFETQTARFGHVLIGLFMFGICSVFVVLNLEKRSRKEIRELKQIQRLLLSRRLDDEHEQRTEQVRRCFSDSLTQQETTARNKEAAELATWVGANAITNAVPPHHRRCTTIPRTFGDVTVAQSFCTCDEENAYDAESKRRSLLCNDHGSCSLLKNHATPGAAVVEHVGHDGRKWNSRNVELTMEVD